MSSKILRLHDVLNKRGSSRSSHYLDIQQGLFTKPVSLGRRAVGWPESEVDTINAARIAGLSDDEISELVKTLEAERQNWKDSAGYQNLFCPPAQD